MRVPVLRHCPGATEAFARRRLARLSPEWADAGDSYSPRACLDGLSLEVLARIFAHLPADAHQRLAVLSRFFRAVVGSGRRSAAVAGAGAAPALPPPSTWAVVRYEDEFTTLHTLPEGVLEALVARAGPSLLVLHAGAVEAPFAGPSLAFLLPLLQRSGAAAQLDTLTVAGREARFESLHTVERALGALPRLTCLAVDVSVTEAALPRLATLAAAHPALQLGRVRVTPWWWADAGGAAAWADNANEPAQRFVGLAALLRACCARELHLDADSPRGAAAVLHALRAADGAGGTAGATNATELHLCSVASSGDDLLLADVAELLGHARVRGVTWHADGAAEFEAACAAMRHTGRVRRLTLHAPLVANLAPEEASVMLDCLVNALVAPEDGAPTPLGRSLRSLRLRDAAATALLRRGGAPTLCEALAALPCLEELSLSNAVAGDENDQDHVVAAAATAAARALALLTRASPSLTSLAVRNVRLGAAGVASIAAALSVLSPPLSRLRRLELTEVGGGAAGIAALAAALPVAARSLQELLLGVAGWGAAGDDGMTWPADVDACAPLLDVLLTCQEGPRALRHVALPYDEWALRDRPLLEADSQATLRLHAALTRAARRARGGGAGAGAGDGVGIGRPPQVHWRREERSGLYLSSGGCALLRYSMQGRLRPLWARVCMRGARAGCCGAAVRCRGGFSRARGPAEAAAVAGLT